MEFEADSNQNKWNAVESGIVDKAERIIVHSLWSAVGRSCRTSRVYGFRRQSLRQDDRCTSRGIRLYRAYIMQFLGNFNPCQHIDVVN